VLEIVDGLLDRGGQSHERAPLRNLLEERRLPGDAEERSGQRPGLLCRRQDRSNQAFVSPVMHASLLFLHCAKLLSYLWPGSTCTIVS
jgi:hypothetical protein